MNGWSDWNTWNVALWLSNDEELYLTAQRAIRLASDLNVAAAGIQLEMPSKTPDGAEFNFSSIKEAIADDHAEFWDV